MPYTVVWERHGCHITYTDRVTFTQFMHAVLDIHAHEHYDRAQYVIHDMTQVAALDFSDLDMTLIVAHELGARFTNPHVRAAVVSSDATMGELTRVFSDKTNLNVGFFGSMADATAWAQRTSALT